MGWARYLRIWLHEVFEIHEFLLERRRAGGYRARCRCGVMLKLKDGKWQRQDRSR